MGKAYPAAKPPMQFPRASGILLHPTSLPGRFGIGDLGNDAFRFAEFLNAARQSLWQVLPLGPTDEGGSPYSSGSAFAGNTLLISPEKLVADRFLQQSDLDEVPSFAPERVDFARVRTTKEALLRKAFDRFQQTTDTAQQKLFGAFKEANTAWLDDYALFEALKKAHDRKPWVQWEPALAMRDTSALSRARQDLSREIEAQKFFQFLFYDQWYALKAFCNQRGIRIVGDLPIFVAHDSTDVWANRHQFKLDEAGQPTVVAGVPPDYFSETGQFWGNPLYDWQRLKEDGFAWWIARLRASLEMCDIVRLDHFRGFVACWEIPAGEATAKNGKWVEAPGRELLAAVRNGLGELPIIAEDLGVITPEVIELRREFGFPGMRVLQFAFDGDETNINLPANYEPDVVAYTGTHDNDTTVGWFNELAEPPAIAGGPPPEAEETRQLCLKFLKSDGREINWAFIEAVFRSDAGTAIIPLQDVLGLGSEARMNTPNTAAGNWSWRYAGGWPGEQAAGVRAGNGLTTEHAVRLKVLTEISGRRLSTGSGARAR
jgi:4-alpha-glucanotransferase